MSEDKNVHGQANPHATQNALQELDVFTCPLDGINQIEASAGTGKTWNICGLYLRLLLERELRVQQILVVTFTNAATAELRERIRARIVETYRAVQAPGSHPNDPFVTTLLTTLMANGADRIAMQQRLDLALQTFDEAAIFTIHGFCQRALADAPFAAGMSFANELLADDSEVALRVVQNFWRCHISNGEVGTELIRYLIDCNDHPEKFAKLLQRHIKKSQARLVWPDDIDTPFGSSSEALAASFAAVRDLWTPDVAADIATLLVASADALNQKSYTAESIYAACAQWHAVLSSDEASVCNEPAHNKLALLSAKNLKDKTKKNKVTPQHGFFDAAQQYLLVQQKAQTDLVLARLRLLRDMLIECAAALRQAKRDQRVLSYDDILYNVFSALCSDGGGWLATRLLQLYPAALIDEFQDTDPLQFAIFNTIYGAGTQPLFFVGDPKQAIYSFRNADLHTYLQAQQTAGARYSLADNQRSSAALIAAQNALFGANSGAFILPGLHYHPVHFGKKPRAQFIDRSSTTAPLQLWTLHDEDGTNLPSLAVAKRLAAQATAAEIARLLRASEGEQITLDGRPLRAGDIAVLVKSHAQGCAIRLALAALQVGCVELSQAGIFSSVDAMEVERILQAIMEPERSGLLLAALATEIFGHDACSIDALFNDEVALLAYTETLLRYRSLWRDRGVGFMFRRLLSEQGVASRMLARPDGERRMTNLLHLTETLHQAAIVHPAPDALVRWLSSQRRNTQVDDDSQLRLESDQNLVQIITIHRSKGLEYPVVFCPFLWQGRLVSRTDDPEGYAYHDDDQQAVIDMRPEPDNLDLLKQKIKEEQAAEFVRLMYVALTRAAHRCYLVAGCYLSTTGHGTSTKEGARSLLNWLVAGNGMTFAQWNKATLEPVEIAAAWRALITQYSSAFGSSVIPTQLGHAVALARPAAHMLVAQPLPPTLPDGWRMTSFSALQHALPTSSGNQYASSDRDTRSSTALQSRAAPPNSMAADDILRFPRGPGAGDTLHAILENLDFADMSTWSQVIRTGLLSHPQTIAGVPRDQQLLHQEQMVRRMLNDITQTQLTDQVRLSEVPRKHCLAELEFNLPVSIFDPQRLYAVLQQGGYATEPLDFKRMSGYLKGFIDLVFETQGKFYLLDWKSNYLGAQAADYDRPKIDQAMQEHGYHLQSLLYTVALHRYLKRRVKNYRYTTHFGGVIYLFLRGVRPHWKTSNGAASGVYFHKPKEMIVEQLDRFFTAIV